MDDKIKAIIIFLLLAQVFIMIPTTLLVSEYRILKERFNVFIDLKGECVLNNIKDFEVENEIKDITNKMKKLGNGKYSIYKELLEIRGLNKRLDNLNNKLIKIVR